MNENDQEQNQYRSEMSHDYYSWEHTFRLVQHLKKAASETDDELTKISLHQGQILSTAILLESAMGHSLFMMTSYDGPHYSSFGPLTHFEERVRVDLKKKVSKFTWSQVESLTKLITGLELKKVCAENWEGVSILNAIRNMVAHGEFVKITETRDQHNFLGIPDEFKIHSRPAITNYLKKCGLLFEPCPLRTEVYIFGERSALHFEMCAYSFMVRYLTALEAEFSSFDLPLQGLLEKFSNSLSDLSK